MSEQKKPSVREVLWHKKHTRDQVLDSLVKLCDESWALSEKIAADQPAQTKDAVTMRELSLRLRTLGYLIEGEHYIDRISFDLQTKDVYMTAREVAKDYISEIVLRHLDGILLYGKQAKWDNMALQEEYRSSLEKPLEEIRAAFIPVPLKQADEVPPETKE